jgi:molecular chaperone GrpE
MTGDSGGFPGYMMRDRRWWARPGEEGAAEESSGAPVPGAQPGQIEALEAELADRDRRLRESVAREREARHEVDQARQRLERDARREIERARRDMIAALLPVLDDLDRAIAAARQGGAAHVFVTGVEHVRSGFLDRLRAFGVERLDPTGQRFDPAKHEAVSVVAARQPGQGGLIIETLSPGYVAVDTDEPIRPAQVVVAGLDGRSSS